MGTTVRSIIGFGSHGLIVDIECSLSNSLPGIIIVGSATRAVDEAKERLRAAFMGSGNLLPRKRITINLAPADIPKADSGLDLGMAAAILLVAQQIRIPEPDTVAFIGELGLDGRVRATKGIIGKLLAGRECGITNFYIASDNLPQARLVPHINLFPVDNLTDLIRALDGTIQQPAMIATGTGHCPITPEAPTSDPFQDIVGQALAKRALQIAAAGGHNLFFSGPPGTGKTMLAKCLPRLLPPLSQEEIIEVSQLHSLAGNATEHPVVTRPFRSPHHSASHVSVTGGGHSLRPGEISLSHRGVLFLDELPEFSRLTLEALRQPLEDKQITVARAKETVSYPANFILVATANPCPCGFYGSSKPCRCLPHQIQRYQQRISGPIIDRIDLFASVHEVDHAHLLTPTTATHTSQELLSRIRNARAAQTKRFRSATQLNADMSNADIKRYAKLEPAATAILNTAAQKLDLSARSYMRVIKLARTIADLDESGTITAAHITEALQYRPQLTQL